MSENNNLDGPCAPTITNRHIAEMLARKDITRAEADVLNIITNNFNDEEGVLCQQ